VADFEGLDPRATALEPKMNILSFKALEEADRRGRAHELLDTWDDTKPLLLEKVERMREAKAKGDRSLQCIVVSHNPNSVTAVFRYHRPCLFHKSQHKPHTQLVMLMAPQTNLQRGASPWDQDALRRCLGLPAVMVMNFLQPQNASRPLSARLGGHHRAVVRSEQRGSPSSTPERVWSANSDDRLTERKWGTPT
jgi:hypothetical protein